MATALAIVLIAVGLALVVIAGLPVCRLAVEKRAKFFAASIGFLIAGLVSLAVSYGHDLGETWPSFAVFTPLFVLALWWSFLASAQRYRDDYLAYLDKLPESNRRSSWVTDLGRLYFDIEAEERWREGKNENGE